MHGLKMMVVGATNDMRTGGAHTHTHSFTLTLTHPAFMWSRESQNGGAGHLDYKAAIENRPRC